uniref:EVE domain-containing protein n=1 Tax=Oryza glaberrima TaxID=4538 RepID=I1PVQ0_ORYGL
MGGAQSWAREGFPCGKGKSAPKIIQIVPWDGVCNRQAINSLCAMRRGDRYLFYHSGAGAASRHIVGVVEVAREWYEGEGEAASGGVVDVRVVGEFRRLVALGGSR